MKQVKSKNRNQVAGETLYDSVRKASTSVEHDPVSGSRSNRILQFRTGSGSDWISKKTQPDPIWISKLN